MSYFSEPSPQVILYVVGACGTLAVEITGLVRDIAANSGRVPERYRSWFFFISHILFAIVATGPLALLLSAGSVPVAFLIGAVSPLIYDKVAAGVQQVEFESERAQELHIRLSRAEEEIKEKPHEPIPIWELAKAQLELYISRNLAQVKNIFWITLVVMTAGFSLVLYGVYRAFSNGPLDVAILTAASGTITQTIGATFLLIYRSTMAQAKEHVGTLERINSVGMALQIVDLMRDGELKDKARLNLVTDILSVSRK